MAASNTIDCFRSFVGEEVKGILTGSKPAPGMHSGSMFTYTLIFKSGRGLTVAANPGGYMVWWEENAVDLNRALNQRARELQATGMELEDVLALAGVEPARRQEHRDGR